jgi:hypothetical protein
MSSFVALSLARTLPDMDCGALCPAVGTDNLAGWATLGPAYVIWWSELLATDLHVSDSISGATRFSET